MAARGCLILVAALVLCAGAPSAGAQSHDELVERYTVLAGSKDDARTLVDGLSASRDFRIGDTAFATPTPELGNGEVNVVLVLAEAKLAADKIVTPTPEQLKGALEPILVQRAGGTGWGEIAHGMGVRLGELMRADRARSEGRLARIERGEKNLERPEKAQRFGRPERPERPEKPDRPDKPDRPEKPQRPERPERPSR